MSEDLFLFCEYTHNINWLIVDLTQDPNDFIEIFICTMLCLADAITTSSKWKIFIFVKLLLKGTLGFKMMLCKDVQVKRDQNAFKHLFDA